jgi:hypothetical protein
MDDVYNSLAVASLDGQQCIEFSGLSRGMSLTRFKSLVAMRIQKLERRYVNPTDLELMAFGEMMTEGGTSLSLSCPQCLTCPYRPNFGRIRYSGRKSKAAYSYPE